MSDIYCKSWCIVCRSTQSVEGILRLCRDPMLKDLYAYNAYSVESDNELKVIYATFLTAQPGYEVRRWIYRYNLNDVDKYPKQHPMFAAGGYKFVRLVKSFLRKGHRVTMTPKPELTDIGGVNDTTDPPESDTPIDE